MSIKEKVELIKQSNINFSQKNWRSKLRQLFNKKMSWDECYDFLKNIVQIYLNHVIKILMIMLNVHIVTNCFQNTDCRII